MLKLTPKKKGKKGHCYFFVFVFASVAWGLWQGPEPNRNKNSGPFNTRKQETTTCFIYYTTLLRTIRIKVALEEDGLTALVFALVTLTGCNVESVGSSH